MTNRTLLVLAIASGCGSAPPPIAHHTAPAEAPPGYTALPGPHSCGEPCGVTQLRDVGSAGILRIGVVERGLESTLAVETASGWFFEPAVERLPKMSSHHQPHSRGYDLTATRVEDSALIVRLIDSLSVFYPGQGPAGSSHTSWFDRRCVVIDALVHCSAPAQIATQSCTSEQDGSRGFQKKCTGGPPPT